MVDEVGSNCDRGYIVPEGYVCSHCCHAIDNKRTNDWCKAKCFSKDDGSYNDECMPSSPNRHCDCLCPEGDTFFSTAFIRYHQYRTMMMFAKEASLKKTTNLRGMRGH